MCTRKTTRNEFPISTNKRKREILELVHTDVCGPMQTELLGEASYFIIFIDDKTRFT